MKNSNPTIYIRSVSEKPGFYIAYFSSEVLQATVSLHFKDSIVGAIALNSFVEMLRIKHKFGNYSLEMDTSIQCRNKAVLDVLKFTTIFPHQKKGKKRSFPQGYNSCLSVRGKAGPVNGLAGENTDVLSCGFRRVSFLISSLPCWRARCRYFWSVLAVYLVHWKFPEGKSRKISVA